LRSSRCGYLINVFDVIVVLAFIAVTVVGAEVVRRTCRRQLTKLPVLPVLPVDRPAAPATAATPATIGTAEID
jgi:hypothetical protein